ncbi:MAG: DnaJ domain-containing protein [Sandaracinaceae bacterium]|nr:DnaJ domain-containing protein [Sandaracinaceae bacterium]
MSYTDYYEVLGVPRDASASQIQKRYRTLAKKFHPDVSKEPDAEERFKAIGEAYEVLKDPEKRALYDKWGQHWRAISEGRAPASPDPGDVRFDFGRYGFNSNVNDINQIFEQVFGGSGPAGRNRGFRPRSDQETLLELGIAKAYKGGPRDIQFVEPQTGMKRRLTVTVPPGVRDGQRIRLGGQASGGRGDLLLTVKLVSDEQFRLEQDDVHVTLRVSPAEAALGANTPLETLDGRVKVRVPPGSSSGRRIRLKERGYPRKGGGRGDLLAEIQIVVPPEPTSEEKRLYEELQRVSRFDPRAG